MTAISRSAGNHSFKEEVPVNANCIRTLLAATALAALSCPELAQAQAASAGPWARVPPLTTLCFQYVADRQQDPFYARLEAARAAVQAEQERQEAINSRIEKDYANLDPMEKASRMQQWMMSNPQEAMRFMQAVQAAPAQEQAQQMALEQQRRSQEAEWNALLTSYGDARLQAYAPAEARRKALAARLGYQYSSARKDLLAPHMGFFADPSTSRADWGAGEAINAEYDRAYKALCPQWWGANGKFQAYLQKQKDWFMTERIPYLERFDAPKLQQYAIMSTPAASYRSTAQFKAVGEYLDLAWKVFNERDSMSRCLESRQCDGVYP